MTELRACTAEEFDDFLENYPRELERNFNHIPDPPIETYSDPSLGVWPGCVVATCCADDWIPKDGYRPITQANGYIRKQSDWKIKQ